MSRTKTIILSIGHFSNEIDELFGGRYGWLLIVVLSNLKKLKGYANREMGVIMGLERIR